VLTISETWTNSIENSSQMNLMHHTSSVISIIDELFQITDQLKCEEDHFYKKQFSNEISRIRSLFDRFKKGGVSHEVAFWDCLK
jgi:RAB protein geranylgeranyltransferase component A